MQFKDIKPNYPVFVLDKQELTITQGKVTNTGFPRIDTNPKTGKSEMVVDVTVEARGKTATYSIPDNLSVTYAGNIILATGRELLVGEIEALQNTAKQFFEMEPYQKRVLEKAPELLAEANPAFRDKQETERRLGAMETSMNEMKALMESFIKKFDS